jgi:hypothetical protein
MFGNFNLNFYNKKSKYTGGTANLILLIIIKYRNNDIKTKFKIKRFKF